MKPFCIDKKIAARKNTARQRSNFWQNLWINFLRSIKFRCDTFCAEISAFPYSPGMREFNCWKSVFRLGNSGHVKVGTPRRGYREYVCGRWSCTANREYGTHYPRKL